jgi:hypothetical protein
LMPEQRFGKKWKLRFVCSQNDNCGGDSYIHAHELLRWFI